MKKIIHLVLAVLALVAGSSKAIADVDIPVCYPCCGGEQCGKK
jgi:hypothetical protein